MNAPVVLLGFVISTAGLSAQEDAQSSVRHVLESSSETPEGWALLPLALGEAAVAAEYAGYAAGGAEHPGDLVSMRTHAASVLHAVDPSRIDEGPGFGFGVKRAAARIIYHIEMAAASDDASERMRVHAEHVATAARNTLGLADRIVEMIAQVRAAESAEEAALLTDELETLSRRLTTGFDADGDGSISWRSGEGGLVQVQQHLDLMLATGGL